ncbi:MAG: asparagine synthase [Lachnospiraceae bacterium]|nr:asparagine synthase [Lachnospiraceae bacterium]
MVDKNYCCSSYLALRFVEKDGVDFFEGLHHKNAVVTKMENRIPVSNGPELEAEIQKSFDGVKGEKLGIMLSGGMDSACLAPYMPGCDAYTFRFLGGTFESEELERAEYFAKTYDMKLHYVDISWDVVERNLGTAFEANHVPVHSIVPQLYEAVLAAKADGIERLVLGECADNRFGGFSRAYSREWMFDDFVRFFTYTEPALALKEPVDMTYAFEPFRIDGGRIDYMRFMQTIYARESETSYVSLFKKCDMKWLYPYENLCAKGGLDYARIRRGETKYIIRELFRDKYPGYPVPEKNPMPRPVDHYFRDWQGPKRPEFREDIPMESLTGNQKWQLWCLERFLDTYDTIH